MDKYLVVVKLLDIHVIMLEDGHQTSDFLTPQ